MLDQTAAEKKTIVPIVRAANEAQNIGLKQKIKASTLLQSKIGMGIMDEDTINKSQSLIDKNKFDFAPIALGFIEELKKRLISPRPKKKPTVNRLSG